MSSAEERRKARYSKLVSSNLQDDDNGKPLSPLAVTAAKATLNDSSSATPRTPTNARPSPLQSVPENAEPTLGSSIHMLQLSPRGMSHDGSGDSGRISTNTNASLNASDNIISIWNQVSDSQRNIVVDNVVNRKILKHSLQVERFEDQEAKSYAKQGDLDYYTAYNLERRAKLADTLPVKEAISRWWRLVPKNFNDDIEKPLYIKLLVAINKVLTDADDFNKSSANEAAETDWERDSKGKEVMTKKMFYAAIFEMVDVWCDAVGTRPYCIFLDCVREHVAKDDGINLRDFHMLVPGSALMAFNKIMDDRSERMPNEKPMVESILQFVPHWRKLIHECKVETVGQFGSLDTRDEDIFLSKERVSLAQKTLAKFASDLAASAEEEMLYPDLKDCDDNVAELFNSTEHDWVSILFKHRITYIKDLARIKACYCPATFELRLFLSDYVAKKKKQISTAGVGQGSINEDEKSRDMEVRFANSVFPNLCCSLIPISRIITKLPGVRVHDFFDLYEIELVSDLDLLSARKLAQLPYMDAILLKQGLELFVRQNNDLHYYPGIFKLWHRIKATHISTLVDHSTAVDSWTNQLGNRNPTALAVPQNNAVRRSKSGTNLASPNRSPNRSPTGSPQQRRSPTPGGSRPVDRHGVGEAAKLVAALVDGTNLDLEDQGPVKPVPRKGPVARTIQVLIHENRTDLSSSVTNTQDTGEITTTLPSNCCLTTKDGSTAIRPIKKKTSGLKRNTSSSSRLGSGNDGVRAGNLRPEGKRSPARPLSAVSPRPAPVSSPEPPRAPSTGPTGPTITFGGAGGLGGDLRARPAPKSGAIRRSRSMTFDDKQDHARVSSTPTLPSITGNGTGMVTGQQNTRQKLGALLAAPNRRLRPTSPVGPSARPVSPRHRAKSPNTQRRFQSSPAQGGLGLNIKGMGK